MLKVTRSDIHEQIGRITAVSTAAIVYGVYNLWLAKPTPSMLHTWLPILGAITSVPISCAYSNLLYVPKDIKSWRLAIVAFCGFIPYVFSLFVIGFLGGGRILGLFSVFAVDSLFAGLAWIIFGYWMLKAFWIITEVVEAYNAGKVVVEPNRRGSE